MKTKSVQNRCQNLSKQPKIPSRTPPERLPKGCRKQVRKAKLWDYRIERVLGSQNDPLERPEGRPKTFKISFIFYIVFTRFRWPLGSQHGSHNPPKSTQNRRPCPCLSCVPLGIRFSSKHCSKVNKAEERRRHFGN